MVNPKLIKLFVSYNFKVLNDSNANKSLYFEILDTTLYLIVQTFFLFFIIQFFSYTPSIIPNL